MRITTTLASILALAAFAAAPVIGADDTTPTTKTEASKGHEVTKITLAEAPEAVQKTIKAEAGDKKIVKIEKVVIKKKDESKTVYEAFIAGEKHITVNPDGTLVKHGKKLEKKEK